MDVTFNGQTFQDVPVDSQGNWFLDVTAPGEPGVYSVSADCDGTVTTTSVEVLTGGAARDRTPSNG